MATETKLPLWRTLAQTAPEIAGAIRAGLDAAGSVMTNKYAEGYPGKRYYGGCEFVDVAERAAIGRAKALFGAEHANVQPHSGAPADMAGHLTLLKPGD